MKVKTYPNTPDGAAQMRADAMRFIHGDDPLVLVRLDGNLFVAMSKKVTR